jgi:hypothetical protein
MKREIRLEAADPRRGKLNDRPAANVVKKDGKWKQQSVRVAR